MNYVEVAVKAAREAGEIHKRFFSSDLKVKTKGKSYDLVTIADVESEDRIVAIIREYFPDHNFLGEEAKYEETSSGYRWIIDPLDGTNNFIAGLPIFCVSIALAKGDEVIAGVIYDPMRDAIFCAEKGKGATMNGKTISVTNVEELSRAILITGFYYDRGKKMVKTLDQIRQFFELNIMGLRRFGAAALDLCYVACGRASGFWEFELSPWDFAAGKLIVEEAGGKVTDSGGKPVEMEKGFIVASNGKIHEKMLEILG